MALVAQDRAEDDGESMRSGDGTEDGEPARSVSQILERMSELFAEAVEIGHSMRPSRAASSSSSTNR